MWSESMPAIMRAVAPPGRRERQERRLARMPVDASRVLPAWRRALVMWRGRTGSQPFALR